MFGHQRASTECRLCVGASGRPLRVENWPKSHYSRADCGSRRVTRISHSRLQFLSCLFGSTQKQGGGGGLFLRSIVCLFVHLFHLLVYLIVCLCLVCNTLDSHISGSKVDVVYNDITVVMSK